MEEDVVGATLNDELDHNITPSVEMISTSETYTSLDDNSNVVLLTSDHEESW